jgi:hypothetical protein
MSTDHPIRLYGHTFKTPLHYIYYFVYGFNDEARKNIMNAQTVDNLLAYNYQLREFAITQDEVNQYLYTMICFMYCRYKDVREAINNLSDDRPAPRYQITNDTYFGVGYAKYSRALLTFRKNIIRPSCA